MLLHKQGEELLEAWFGMSQQHFISSSRAWKPNWGWFKTPGLQQRQKKATRGHLNLIEDMLTLPSWISMHSEGAVCPGFPSSFSSVTSPWGGRHRSPGDSVTNHTKQKQEPMTSLLSSSSFVFLSLFSFQLKGNMRETWKLYWQVQVAGMILFWPEIIKKIILTKPLNTDYSFNFIPRQLSWDSPEGVHWSVMTLHFRHWQVWKKAVSTS